MDETEYEVKVYIYEISGGLARSLSLPLLGRQIEGVWHTGIVVYGQEFYFGGMGIESCPPGGTVVGEPNEIVSLGKTQIPFDLFMEHLQELSQSTFRPECYHLFDHNCNTFSNEVALFLTGNSIPSHITSLPQEIMQTPFGAMIRPFFDSMSVNPGRAGSRTLFSNVGTSDVTPNQNKPSDHSSTHSPDAVVFSDKAELDQCRNLHELLVAANLSVQDVKLMDDVLEYVSNSTPATSNWSLGPVHVQVLCRIIVDGQYSLDIREKLLTVLQLALCLDDVINVCKHDIKESMVLLLLQFESMEGRLAAPFARCVCNCASTKQGAEWFLTLKCQQQNNSLLFPILSRDLLLNQNPAVRQIGCQFVSNVFRHLRNPSEELAFDLGISLIEACRLTNHATAEYLWFSLSSCLKINSQLSDLMAVMEVTVGDYEAKFPAIRKYTAAVRPS